MVILIIILIIVFGGIFGYDALRSHMMKQYFANFQPPPATISAIKAKNVAWTPYISSVGSITAYKGVNITAQQAGQVDKIYFRSGELVKQGEPLIGQNVALDAQDLKNFQAKLVLAQASFDREQKLFKTHFVSAADFDSAKANLEEAKADVVKTQNTIDQKTIKAPFAGKIGIRVANVGQYLNPGDQLAALQSLNPLRVIFSTPEQNLSQLKVGQAIKIKVDTYPDEIFTGKISAIDSEVNTQTRNIQIEANVPNDQLKLVPGMFANVKVLMPHDVSAIVIPQTAINYTLYGDSVYHLVPDKKAPKTTTKQTKKKDKTAAKASKQKLYIAKQVYVTLGKSRGSEVQVLTGIKAGDLIVSSGQLKLQNGSRAVVNNSSNINLPPKTINTEE